MPATQWVGTGRLGADPQFSETEGKKPYVTFQIACQTNRAFPPVWKSLAAWDGQRDVIERLKLHKGDYVSVVGIEIADRKPEDSDCKRFHTRVKIQQIFLIVRARSSEEKHYDDIEREAYGEDKPAPF